MAEGKCAIWGTEAKLLPFLGEPNPYEYESARVAGMYKVTGTAKGLLTFLTEPEKAKLTTWVVSQRMLGNLSPLITEKSLDEAKVQNFLKNSERIDRFFTYLNVSNYRLVGSIFSKELDLEVYNYQGVTYHSFSSDDEISAIKAYTECIDEYEIWRVKEYLEASGYIKDESDEHEQSSSWSILTPLGLKKLDELSNSNLNSQKAFVAMWFDPNDKTVFDQAIKPAIEINPDGSPTGFKAVRVDREHHTDFIMDFMIGNIKRSRFMVADFSSYSVKDNEGNDHQIPRGGVYFEAGYALGLNIPVIATCREDQKDAIHFDLKQFNTIYWKDVDELKKLLSERIFRMFVT